MFKREKIFVTFPSSEGTYSSATLQCCYSSMCWSCYSDTILLLAMNAPFKIDMNEAPFIILSALLYFTTKRSSCWSVVPWDVIYHTVQMKALAEFLITLGKKQFNSSVHSFILPIAAAVCKCSVFVGKKMHGRWIVFSSAPFSRFCFAPRCLFWMVHSLPIYSSHELCRTNAHCRPPIWMFCPAVYIIM